MKQFIYIWIVVLFSACYDDKGNYDYRDINEVDVVLPAEYSISLEKDTVLVIKPELSQTLQKNADNLRYSWFHSVKGTNFHTTIANYTDTISFSSDTASFITYEFDPADKNLIYKHYFRFEVEDIVTGVVYPMNTVVSLGKPYTGAWMILQRNDEGKARLGAIQYVGGDIKVESDVFAKIEGGSPFVGAPVCLGRCAGPNYMYQKSTTAEWMTFSVITDRPEESGTYCQWKQFGFGDEISLDGVTTQNYVFDEGVCLQTSARDLDVAKMCDYDGEGNRGSIFLADGQLYSVLKSAKVSKAAVHTDIGEVEITHAAKVGRMALAYDAKGHRFVYYDMEKAYSAASALFTSNDDTKVFGVKLNKVPKKADDPSDPSVIEEGEEVLFIGSGYNYNASNMGAYTYGYALTLKGDKCKIYEFDGYGITGTYTRSLVNTYEFDRPAHLTKESCFASSSAFDGFLFYTSGMYVYRLDFKQSKPSEVAIAALNSEAIGMKFARTNQVASTTSTNLAAYSSYEFDINRSLGIVCKIGNTMSEFVVINLSASGNLDANSEHYAARQIYSEFGEIVDFVFI